VTITTLRVSGMTCEHCVRAVTSELAALGGVDDVSVDLVPGGASAVTVRSSRELPPAELRAAVDDAGYTLADD
jgi:copper chaperone